MTYTVREAIVKFWSSVYRGISQHVMVDKGTQFARRNLKCGIALLTVGINVKNNSQITELLVNYFSWKGD